MKAVDAHCHLDFKQFNGDREKVINRARDSLEFVVNAGSNPEHNRKALELETGYPGFIVANLGLHPAYPDDYSRVDEVEKQVRENDPAAVGEIGLDYHHVTDRDMREEQVEVFRQMLELAEELDKPVVVHSRDAERKAVDLLKTYSLPDVMLHCFNGKPGLAEEAVEAGMTVGISTQVLYSSRVKEIVERLRPEDLLLETDSPFLYQGERNEPVNVVESAEAIAGIKNTEADQVVLSTTRNARRIFR